MTFNQHAGRALLSALTVAALTGIAHAQHSAMDHSHHHANTEKVAAMGMEAATVRLSNAALSDQNGAQVLLKDDVLANEIVVVDFIFTTCTTICPVTTALLSASKRDHEALADVKYVSISIDPNTDTPERLTDFAAKHRADWTFLTGQKSVMDQVLLDMDAYSTNPEDHAPMILVGDAKSGEFVRLFGLPQAEQILSHVAHFKSTRNTGGHGAHHGHH